MATDEGPDVIPHGCGEFDARVAPAPEGASDRNASHGENPELIDEGDVR